MPANRITLQPNVTPYGYFVARWLRLAMPEDVQQEIALAALLGRTEAQRRDALQYRLRELRRTQWERRPCKPATAPRSLRPSKVASITGYRADSAAHREARQKVNAPRRREIAEQGASSRWSAASSSRAS